MRAAVSAKYCGVQKLAGVSTRYLPRRRQTPVKDTRLLPACSR